MLETRNAVVSYSLMCDATSTPDLYTNLTRACVFALPIDTLRNLLFAIHATMDGTEWDADTLQEIALRFKDAGLPLREPDYADDDRDDVTTQG